MGFFFYTLTVVVSGSVMKDNLSFSDMFSSHFSSGSIKFTVESNRRIESINSSVRKNNQQLVLEPA